MESDLSILEVQLCLDYLWRILQNIPECRDRNKYHFHPEINLDYHPSRSLSMTSDQATCKFLRGTADSLPRRGWVGDATAGLM